MIQRLWSLPRTNARAACWFTAVYAGLTTISIIIGSVAALAQGYIAGLLGVAIGTLPLVPVVLVARRTNFFNNLHREDDPTKLGHPIMRWLGPIAFVLMIIELYLIVKFIFFLFKAFASSE